MILYHLSPRWSLASIAMYGLRTDHHLGRGKPRIFMVRFRELERAAEHVAKHWQCATTDLVVWQVNVSSTRMRRHGWYWYTYDDVPTDRLKLDPTVGSVLDLARDFRLSR